MSAPRDLRFVTQAAAAARNARADADRLQAAYVGALRKALETHSGDEVAAAAGVSKRGMYLLLQRHAKKGPPPPANR